MISSDKELIGEETALCEAVAPGPAATMEVVPAQPSVPKIAVSQQALARQPRLPTDTWIQHAKCVDTSPLPPSACFSVLAPPFPFFFFFHFFFFLWLHFLNAEGVGFWE